MNLRRRKPHDSLYMLLDTMCNAFGGIILLAVLVVLLTSKEKTQNANAAETTELQRRIALAETNLQKSLQLSDSLHKQATDAGWKDQVSLLATRQQLENELKQLRELAAQNQQDIDANAGSDPADRMKKLDSLMAENDTKKLDAKSKISAAEEQKQRTAARLVAAEKQMDETAKLSQHELRLPKEHDTDKTALFVIVRYHRIYTCHNVDGTRDETDIHWTDSEGVETAEPKKNKGLDLIVNAQQLTAYFTAQTHNSVYVAFIVMPDSFPTFLQVKQMAIDCGLQYGWMPWDTSQQGEVGFSAAGYAPSAQ